MSILFGTFCLKLSVTGLKLKSILTRSNNYIKLCTLFIKFTNEFNENLTLQLV